MEPTAHTLDCPVAPDHLRVEETGEDVIVFDSETELFHFMNPTAFAIFQACNGANSITDIARILDEQFEIKNAEAARQDVLETIDQLRDQGLVK